MQKKIISTSTRGLVKIHNPKWLNKNRLNKVKHRGDTDIENYEKIQNSTNTEKHLNKQRNGQRELRDRK